MMNKNKYGIALKVFRKMWNDIMHLRLDNVWPYKYKMNKQMMIWHTKKPVTRMFFFYLLKPMTKCPTLKWTKLL